MVNISSENHVFVLPQTVKLLAPIKDPKMDKTALQTELYRRLNDAWVLCSLDVRCGEWIADVALHTRSFIFGRVIVCGESGASRLEEFGIKSISCRSWGDIDACVKWAVELQEQYVHCHARGAVA